MELGPGQWYSAQRLKGKARLKAIPTRITYEVRGKHPGSLSPFITGLVPSLRSLRAFLREPEYYGDSALIFTQPVSCIKPLTFPLGSI